MTGLSVNRPSNPLALAVLALLRERPMHPYEMAATLRSRGKDRSIKLRYGSLYTVIDALQKGGLVHALETVREGRRPERTVMEITPDGERLLTNWMSELLQTPVREYPQFVAALSLMPVLPPEEVVSLLRERSERLASDIQAIQNDLAEPTTTQRVFLIEEEYRLTLLQTEHSFIINLAEEISTGSLEGLDFWRRFHSERTTSSRGADRPGKIDS